MSGLAAGAEGLDPELGENTEERGTVAIWAGITSLVTCGTWLGLLIDGWLKRRNA